MKQLHLFVFGFLAAILITWAWPTSAVERFDLPLAAGDRTEFGVLAQLDPPSPPRKTGGEASAPWLHVEVETKYAWIYQKSIGRAWVSASRDDTTRVKVGELCLQLECYGTHKICETDTSYLEVTEIKRRIAVKKKKAIVSAWANGPELERTTVEMMP